MSVEIDSTNPNHRPASQWCAVFDTRTGTVVHIHQVIASNSADLFSREELGKQALTQVPRDEQFRLAEGLLPREVPDPEYLEVAWPGDDPLEGIWNLHVDLDTRQVIIQRSP